MAESVLREIFPYFEEGSTTISREKLELLQSVGRGGPSEEVLEIVIRELRERPNMSRIDLLKSILFYSENENIKKATIEELVRLKTEELKDILSGYLKSNRNNTPSKVAAIRALGKVAIKRYLERK